MIYPGSVPASSPDLGVASVTSGQPPPAPTGQQGMMLAEGLGLASLGGQAAAYSAHNGHSLEKSVRIVYHWKMSPLCPLHPVCECKYFVFFSQPFDKIHPLMSRRWSSQRQFVTDCPV